MDLQGVLQDAATAFGEFHSAHDTVVEDQTKLKTDQDVELTKAATAQTKAKAAMDAITNELAQLPPIPPPPTV